jgi:tRNA threonylcarbamoyladenosine biosynthesis protein TsaE
MVQASGAPDRIEGTYESISPESTFNLGCRIGSEIRPGDLVLLRGGLGAGKTLFTKGLVNAFEFDVDEVTSPSFTLVNYYETPKFDVYHIDLWRLDDKADVAAAVGLDEILNGENAVAVIEWSEKLRNFDHHGRVIRIQIEGDGDEPRAITIKTS